VQQPAVAAKPDASAPKGQIYLDGKPVSPSELKKALKTAPNNRPAPRKK
jgi:hypothetical protein